VKTEGLLLFADESQKTIGNSQD